MITFRSRNLLDELIHQKSCFLKRQAWFLHVFFSTHINKNKISATKMRMRTQHLAPFLLGCVPKVRVEWIPIFHGELSFDLFKDLQLNYDNYEMMINPYKSYSPIVTCQNPPRFFPPNLSNPPGVPTSLSPWTSPTSAPATFPAPRRPRR